jgi:ribosome-associated protein
VTDDLRSVVLAASAAESKTDDEVAVLEVGEVLAITNWFVIASGRNPRQVKTIAEEVERVVADDDGTRPQRVEGLDTLQWVLLDYGEFVVHVFHEEARRFYDLERLWGDVPRVAWREAAQQP